jgi:hypothetical protein
MSIGRCKRCGNEIAELYLSEEQRLEVWGLLNQGFQLWAVKMIKDADLYSHREAKIIVEHLNKAFGKCIRCNFADLKEENTECPKCKAFNYNLKIAPPFNQDFCSHLEYKLDFEGLDDENFKGFWCDGISHFPTDFKSLARAKIEYDKKIITKAWIGLDGQEEYEMTIHFGTQAIKSYQNNQSLVECIPDNHPREWIFINPSQKKIEIKLK